MVGEVCEREISNFDMTRNVSNNSNGESNLMSLQDEQKIKIAVALTLLVGIIQV